MIHTFFMLITLDDLNDASAQFHQQEKRGSFYDMALDLVKRGLEVEGCLLLMATWNFARFRYAVNDFDIDGFRKALDDLRVDFAVLSSFTIRDVSLDEHGPRIKRIFEALAKWKGIEYTGATKIMQLKCPELFVIWDAFIRGEKPSKAYCNLTCVKTGKWSRRYYETTGEGYLDFLRDMQSRVAHITYATGRSTLAKAIDEFNYVHVTLPMQRDQKEQEAKKKAAKRSARLLP